MVENILPPLNNHQLRHVHLAANIVNNFRLSVFYPHSLWGRRQRRVCQWGICTTYKVALYTAVRDKMEWEAHAHFGLVEKHLTRWRLHILDTLTPVAPTSYCITPSPNHSLHTLWRNCRNSCSTPPVTLPIFHWLLLPVRNSGNIEDEEMRRENWWLKNTIIE